MAAGSCAVSLLSCAFSPVTAKSSVSSSSRLPPSPPTSFVDLSKGDRGLFQISAMASSQAVQHSWRDEERWSNGGLETSESREYSSAYSDDEDGEDVDDLRPLDSYFYYLARRFGVKAYGVEFKEASNSTRGIGVYAARDIDCSQRAKVLMEIPLPVMVGIGSEPPWMFYPDFLPFTHPLFLLINATDPDKDADIRLACLLLLAMDDRSNLWFSYSEFLPPPDDCPSLLLATKEELLQLQDEALVQKVEEEKNRIRDFWQKNMAESSDSSAAVIPWALRKILPSWERLLWAVAIVQTRHVTMHTPMGTLLLDTQLLVPFADMLNHSYDNNCQLRWRMEDRVVEVVTANGVKFKKGEEITVSYAEKQQNQDLMLKYGFSLEHNMWETIQFSKAAVVNRDAMMSAFNIIGGVGDEFTFHHNPLLAPLTTQRVESDWSLLASVRTLPLWDSKDVPPLPSAELAASRKLQMECEELLRSFPTSIQEDEAALRGMREDEESSCRLMAAIEYRLHKKLFLTTISHTLDTYCYSLFF